MHSHTDCPSLAQTTPISSVAETAHSQPNTITMQPDVANAMYGESLTPMSSNTPSDCMAVIDKRLSCEGLSKKTKKITVQVMA
ncbi:hypothetical protein DPMN_113077 [Dreissena polymorpha]|uniref:Uncharacterized protein n=1 Tax=Dreissena polymorpha TaxID=45954 RepID=A0A9D4KGU6_DREPO|nr:hypothetical protein DPMN_113077 [Dreissena polymorpha]